MKTSKEFFERLQTDEDFAKEVGEKLKAKVEAGEKDYKALWIPLAAEYGYELTGEELDEMCAQTELSEEELGKVAGGSSPACGVVLAVGTPLIIPLSVKLTFKIFD